MRGGQADSVMAMTRTMLGPGFKSGNSLLPRKRSLSTFPQPIHRNLDFATANQQLELGFPLPMILPSGTL